VIVGSAVTVSVAAIVFFGALGAGLYQNVVVPLLPRLPLDLIKVEPRVLSLGMLAFDGPGGIDAQAIRRLSNIEGVERVFPVVGAGFPLRGEGGAKFLGGAGIRTDLFATGLDPALVAPDIAKGHTFADPGPDGNVIPIVVARRLLDLYNTTVAPAIQRPRLSEEAVIGFSFNLVLGSSYVRGTPDPSKVESKIAQIVGFSDQANLVGITVPAATLERWNTRHGDGKSPIVGAYVRTKGPTLAGHVSQQIEKLGLQVDDTQKIVGAVVASAGAVLGLIALLLIGMATFAIAQTFFLLVGERRVELAVLRAMGAKRRHLFRLVMAEALVLGAASGLVGVVLGVAAALGLDALGASMLPDIPFKPSSFVAFPMSLVLGAWLVGVIASLVGAFLPARIASRADPALALKT